MRLRKLAGKGRMSKKQFAKRKSKEDMKKQSRKVNRGR